MCGRDDMLLELLTCPSHILGGFSGKAGDLPDGALVLHHKGADEGVVHHGGAVVLHRQETPNKKSTLHGKWEGEGEGECCHKWSTF